MTSIHGYEGSPTIPLRPVDARVAGLQPPASLRRWKIKSVRCLCQNGEALSPRNTVRRGKATGGIHSARSSSGSCNDGPLDGARTAEPGSPVRAFIVSCTPDEHDPAMYTSTGERISPAEYFLGHQHHCVDTLSSDVYQERVNARLA